MLLERYESVVQELSRREQEEDEEARAQEASTRLEFSTPVVWYPKQYPADDEYIRMEPDAQAHSVTKPSRDEKVVAAHANAFERGDMVAVTSVGVTIAKRQASRRAATSLVSFNS